MAAQGDNIVSNEYPCVSHESFEETEPHSKSLMVSQNEVFQHEQQNSVLNILPPPFLSRNTGVTGGTQTSSVQCSQTESIKPSQDTIATLQDNLHRIGIKNGDTKVEPTDCNFSNPAAKQSWASIEQPCPPSPLSKIRSVHLARQPSQASQCSTVKANSSGSNSPASDYATPRSSPLPSSRMEHASGKVNSKPTQCTEASLNEHRVTGEDWQTNSIKYIQGANCIVSGSSDENHYPPSPSRTGKLR